MDEVHSPDGRSDLEAGSADILDPAVCDLVAQIFAKGSARLRTEDGADLRAERIASYRDLVLVHAPRLALEPDLKVTGTCETPYPWAVTFVVRDVEPYSGSAETVALEAVQSSLYPERRREPRIEVGGKASVTIHYGVEMVEEERFGAELVDVSRTGLAFASGADIAVGTQVTIESRLLLGYLRLDVQVRWRGDSRVPEMYQFGCEVLHPNSAEADILGKLVDAAPGVPEPGQIGSQEELRRMLVGQPRKRRLFGRRAASDG